MYTLFLDYPMFLSQYALTLLLTINRKIVTFNHSLYAEAIKFIFAISCSINRYNVAG